MDLHDGKGVRYRSKQSIMQLDWVGDDKLICDKTGRYEGGLGAESMNVGSPHDIHSWVQPMVDAGTV